MNDLNPREFYDNATTMVCFHRRYVIGDKHEYKISDYNGWGEVEAQIKKDNDIAVLLPLYIYDHSGVTISTSPFSCSWDSGQVGFIFITKQQVRETYMKKKVTKPLIDKALTLIEAEVKEYDSYLRGDYE